MRSLYENTLQNLVHLNVILQLHHCSTEVSWLFRIMNEIEGIISIFFIDFSCRFKYIYILSQCT